MSYYTPEERRFRIIAVILAIAAIIIALVAINQCSGSTTGEEPGSGLYSVYDDEPDPGVEPDNDDDMSLRTRKSVQNVTNRITQTPIYVPVQAGERYEDCFIRQYPELGRLKDKGMGGAKLLGETCADANGDNKSTSDDDEIINGPELDRIGIGVDDSDDGLPNRILNGDVEVKTSPIDTKGGTSGWYSIFGLYFEIENLTGREIDVVIRRGLLLETIGDNVQNLVIRKSVSVHLKAYERQTVRVFAYCASHHRSSPEGYHVRVTPFYLMAEESAYYSQTSIWEWQEKMYASWKRQTVTDSIQVW